MILEKPLATIKRPNYITREQALRICPKRLG
jgi:hypothetical protein